MTMLAWERADEARGHSAARWDRLGDGYLFHGTEVLVSDEETLSCWFRVRLDDDWRTVAVDATAVAASGERSCALVADPDRRWTVDGVRRPDLDGCLDVDVAATPLTNTFPIRRLADLAVGGISTSPVAWVDVPRLGVTRIDQTYERLPARGGYGAWRYSDPQHGAFMLTVDADGLVMDYEGFARRVRRRGPAG